MKKILLFVAVLLTGQPFAFSQTLGDTITQADVKRIISYLSADAMKGRGNGRPELLKAASFIGDSYSQDKLLPLIGMASYYLPFRPFGGSKNSWPDDLSWNNKKMPNEQFMYINQAPGNYSPKQLTDFTVLKLDSFFTPGLLAEINSDTSALLIWTDHKQPDGVEFFPENISIPTGGIKRNLLLVYAETAPERLVLTANTSYYNTTQYNVIAMLPGRSRPKELVLVTSHYDHEGVFDGERSDSIMNGANDNASGVTAMLILAHYYAMRNDNERTIVFCAFSGEELGLKGSYEFVNVINPDKIVAGVNIEMIGVRQYRKNSVFITGRDYSNLPSILDKELRKGGIKTIPEPDESKGLFMRSDNYPFAEKGVPAHTIMASDDDDPCYHQPCDELKRIDIPNMTAIIKGIATAIQPLVQGVITPGRPDPRQFEREKPSNFRIRKSWLN